MAAQVFRAGVILVVERVGGEVLVFERADVPGAWQLPQGGIDIGETPVEAAWRELREETALTSSCVQLVREIPEWIAYEWPDEIRSRSQHGDSRRGQIQKWFFFRMLDVVECRPEPDGKEFIACKWLTVPELLADVAAFRRDAYLRAFSTEG